MNIKPLFTVSFSILLASCFGADENKGSGTFGKEPTNQMSGVVSGGAYGYLLANAKVCFDANDNFTCDEGETYTISDSTGNFLFSNFDEANLLNDIQLIAEINKNETFDVSKKDLFEKSAVLSYPTRYFSKDDSGVFTSSLADAIVISTNSHLLNTYIKKLRADALAEDHYLLISAKTKIENDLLTLYTSISSGDLFRNLKTLEANAESETEKQNFYEASQYNSAGLEAMIYQADDFESKNATPFSLTTLNAYDDALKALQGVFSVTVSDSEKNNAGFILSNFLASAYQKALKAVSTPETFDEAFTAIDLTNAQADLSNKLYKFNFTGSLTEPGYSVIAFTGNANAYSQQSYIYDSNANPKKYTPILSDMDKYNANYNVFIKTNDLSKQLYFPSKIELDANKMNIGYIDDVASPNNIYSANLSLVASKIATLLGIESSVTANMFSDTARVYYRGNGSREIVLLSRPTADDPVVVKADYQKLELKGILEIITSKENVKYVNLPDGVWIVNDNEAKTENLSRAISDIKVEELFLNAQAYSDLKAIFDAQTNISLPATSEFTNPESIGDFNPLEYQTQSRIDYGV